MKLVKLLQDIIGQKHSFKWTPGNAHTMISMINPVYDQHDIYDI